LLEQYFTSIASYLRQPNRYQTIYFLNNVNTIKKIGQ
jgi:hypothetical protein